MSDGFSTGAGERLLWSGRPDPWRYLLKKGLAQLLVSIPFYAFVFIFFLNRHTAAASNPFPWEFMILFVASGVYTLLLPIWHFYRGAFTSYALTSQRAVIDYSGMFPRRTSFPLGEIRLVELSSTSPRGVGHVLFYEPPPSKYSYSIGSNRDGFIAIPDAAQVEQQLRAAIAKFADARLGATPA
jgi:hypothetical protein